MDPGSIVVVHLANPTEKHWGVLHEIAVHGVTLRCINVESFEDWTRSIAADETPTLGLSTIFFPMNRVERLFLDERIGEVESLCEQFARRVGHSVDEYLRAAGQLTQEDRLTTH